MARRERRGAEEPRVGVQTRLEACDARRASWRALGGAAAHATMRGVVCGAMRSAPSGKNVAGVRAARHAAPRRTLSRWRWRRVVLACSVAQKEIPISVFVFLAQILAFGPHASRVTSRARAQVICAGAAGRGSREVSAYPRLRRIFSPRARIIDLQFEFSRIPRIAGGPIYEYK